MNEYVVQPGDTLSKIAAKILGDAKRWPEIATLNNLRNPNLILVGQRLQIPPARAVFHDTGKNFSNAGSPAARTVLAQYGPAAFQPSPAPFPGEMPASVALARGFLFIVFEQLPDVGAGKIIRKVAAIPKDFSMQPMKPNGTLTPAEHAMGGQASASQYLSASERPFGAPSMDGAPLLIDVEKVKAAGGRIYSVQEVVADLKRFAAENPGARTRIEKLISTIEKIEGEVLVAGGVDGAAVSTLSAPHTTYVKSAEDLWREFREARIARPELEAGLEKLGSAYRRAKIVGRVGRALTVVGVILTVKDLADATERTVEQHSLKPLSAEVVRQAGGWGAAAAGGKIGFMIGTSFGIETGPGAIVTGAVGAMVFGALGYFGADLIADQISPN